MVFNSVKNDDRSNLQRRRGKEKRLKYCHFTFIISNRIHPNLGYLTVTRDTPENSEISRIMQSIEYQYVKNNTEYRDMQNIENQSKNNVKSMC